MPVCYITLSDRCSCLDKKQIQQIRKIVAKGLNSNSKKLDRTHITIRIQHSLREGMLGDIELDIYSQLYLRRFFSRDKRANYISQKISSYLGCCCATWINMGYVGYSRSDTDGNMFFSDSDNFIIRFIQKVRGISTKNSKIKYSLKRKILNKKMNNANDRNVNVFITLASCDSYILPQK